ncbi:uncharacterized protein SPSK_06635 [Sporothrix schenckii 1099-18]|uniref:Ubiquitin 3 binding protein But2 C-terminal domain-containing protein n=2 Tax=Sporothrix schenckii TaxID=29908 RepID=U7PHY1_SPOS1|nr:uncharacterized protein SPSK_06635 [Sporothrix schenckii 1099-18]ERS95137.1 hypothetical protein HMPREF1624_08347 [Sporothrix schenckii ATCC 58251]KJR89925.1 hypothetical protein SPSK_06635 [Sporothrix schenckii 1099-18]
MKSFASLVVVSLFAGLVAAVPTPADTAPLCGTTYYPTILQQLSEASPNTVGANTAATSGDFHVSQTVITGSPSDRIYQLVGFQGIPSGSFGCELALTFPAGYPITSSVGGVAGPTPMLNVTTVLRNNPSAIAYPNGFTFNSFPTQLGPSQGPFGTVSAAAGTTVSINSESCDSNLAFVFSIASWTGTSAGVEFAEHKSPLAGVYLTASC